MTGSIERRPEAVISVCVSCRAEDGSSPGDSLLTHLRSRDGDPASSRVAIRPVQCLGVCKRPCTVSLTGEGRYTYVFGDLDPESGADALFACASLYLEADHGYLLWRERPEALRRGIVSRIPPTTWQAEDGRHPR